MPTFTVTLPSPRLPANFDRWLLVLILLSLLGLATWVVRRPDPVVVYPDGTPVELSAKAEGQLIEEAAHAEQRSQRKAQAATRTLENAIKAGHRAAQLRHATHQLQPGVIPVDVDSLLELNTQLTRDLSAY